MKPSPLAPNLWVGDDVRIGEGVGIGVNVVLHDGAVLEDGCTIDHGAVVGRPTRLGPHSRAAPPEPAPTVVGASAVVGCNAILCTGARVAERAVAADHSLMRERSSLGEESVLGHNAALGAGTAVGARVRIMNASLLVARSRVEDDVFVGPSMVVLNDNAAGRRPPGAPPLPGLVLRRRCRIGGAVVFLPGLEVGEDAFVAAGSLVTHDVPAGALVMGSPARVRGEAPTAPAR